MKDDKTKQKKKIEELQEKIDHPPVWATKGDTDFWNEEIEKLEDKIEKEKNK